MFQAWSWVAGSPTLQSGNLSEVSSGYLQSLKGIPGSVETSAGEVGLPFLQPLHVPSLGGARREKGEDKDQGGLVPLLPRMGGLGKVLSLPTLPATPLEGQQFCLAEGA